MRKLLFLLIVCALNIMVQNTVIAQDTTNASPAPVAAEQAAPEAPAASDEPISGHQLLKQWFIDGGWIFMAPILVCFIIGLAICIERTITLNLAAADTDKLVGRLSDSLKKGNLNEAREICKATAGPTASVLYEGLGKAPSGGAEVEKAIVNYGGVQMAKLEDGLSWISLFIALAPMLGFFGTVIGMIQAFEDIAKAGDIDITVVASGIKVALLTTVFGLVVAMVLQFFYSYFLTKIEAVTSGMQTASIKLMNILEENNTFSKG